MVKFIVLSTQRSGSSYLGTLLSSHHDVTCFEELFMPKNRHDIAFRAYKSASVSRRLQNAFWRRDLIFRFLDELVASQPADHAVGFKFMYRQAKRHPQVVEWCKQNDVRIVHLVRKNLLKIVVSRILAKERGIYHSKEALRAEKVHLDPSRILQQLDAMTASIRHNAKLFSGNPSIEVFYEDFVANKNEESQRILQFLDVDGSESLTSDLVKINTDKLEDLIANYATVARILKGSAHERLLQS